MKWKKDVHKLSLAVIESLGRVIMRMSEAGLYVPPVMIILRKLMMQEYSDELLH